MARTGRTHSNISGVSRERLRLGEHFSRLWARKLYRRRIDPARRGLGLSNGSSSRGGMIREFFDQFEKVTDILNVGRLIFYPAAGLLTLVPAAMILHMMLMVAPQPTLLAQMASDARGIVRWAGERWLVASLASVVVGFVIAILGFAAVLIPLGRDLKKALALAADVDRESFPYNYPVLREKPADKSSQDYAAWLLSEYYRYVEIATYIPLGGVIGLVLMEVYVFVFLVFNAVRVDSPGLTSAHGVLLLGLVSLLLIVVYGWPAWRRRVIAPTIQTYFDAKRNLIAGVKERPGGSATPPR